MLKMLFLNRNFYIHLFGTLGILYYKMRLDNKINELNDLVKILENINEGLKTKNMLLEEEIKKKDDESKRIIEDCEKELLNENDIYEDSVEKYEDLSSPYEYDKLD